MVTLKVGMYTGGFFARESRASKSFCRGDSMTRICPNRNIGAESKIAVENTQILARGRAAAFKTRDVRSHQASIKPRPGNITDLQGRGVAHADSTGKRRA
jgi:hypothetical protein